MATVDEEEHAVLDRLTFDYHQKLQGKPQSHELVGAGYPVPRPSRALPPALQGSHPQEKGPRGSAPSQSSSSQCSPTLTFGGCEVLLISLLPCTPVFPILAPWQVPVSPDPP